MTTSSVILHPEIDQARSALVNTESLESISTCFGSAMFGNQSGRESNLIAGVFTRNQSQELVQTHSYDSFQSSIKPKTENIHFLILHPMFIVRVSLPLDEKYGLALGHHYKFF
ncbi:hypothetical protein PPACK8108_LOCUS26069 [Phakopsora pachyrhizi]|uniref:Uncharacterized protein n=1 Tax=Phakopsora pachyrhizi TaxID=170000 RepID=A0AAV0BT47_PHAPC|nr:hypothetical protein PPACK8108_LOCUS26069 [Phakopsora pachyrhizi]